MSATSRAPDRVGVVVVHYGDLAPTVACVRALVADPSPCERRILVVDNSGNAVAGELAGAEIVATGGNKGFGAGVNRGVAALGPGPWGALVVLNNDVEVGGGYLGAAVRALWRPRVGAAAGPLRLEAAGGPLWYAGGGVNFLFGTVRQAKTDRAAARARNVGFISGAALAVSHEAWRDVGGFDPSYFLYNEDVDLCLRLRRKAWRLRFEPAMAAVHALGAVTGSAARSPLYLEHMAASRLRPFRPLPYRLYLAALHSGYVALRALWYAAVVRGGGGREAAGALLRGHARALAGLLHGPRRDG